MADETDDQFMKLEEASALLIAKGLTGQTVAVLRSAIAGRRLAGLKDGRCWKTSRKALDDYVGRLWDAHGQPSPFPNKLPRLGRPLSWVKKAPPKSE